MSWVNTLLNVAEVGLELGQLAQLQNIKDQQTTALMGQLSETARKALIESARNELFNIKQFASAAIKLHEENPKSAAGAIRYAQLRLDDYSITPDVFPDLKDKEYCAEVRQLLSDNDKSFMSALPTEEQIEVVDIAKTALRMPDYNYYLENYANVQELRSAQALTEERKYKKQGGLNARLDNSKMGKFSYYFIIVLCGIVPFFFSSGFLGFVITAALFWGLGWFTWKTFKKRQMLFQTYQTAKQKVETLGKKVNMEYFQQLEAEFGTNYDQVNLIYQDNNRKVTGLFADLDSAQALLR